MERLWRLSPRLVATAVAISILVLGCAAASDTPPVNAGVNSPTATPAPPTPVPTPRPTAVPTSTSAHTPTPTPTPVPLPALKGLDAELVSDGFDQPVLVIAAPGTDALFVVEREGIILVVENGQVAPEPFLDLRDQMTSSSIEQGLLGLAFHPDYENNQQLFVYWTQASGDSRLAAFTAASPTRVDRESMRVLLDIDQPAERHNAACCYLALRGSCTSPWATAGAVARRRKTPPACLVRFCASTWIEVTRTPSRQVTPSTTKFGCMDSATPGGSR